MRPLVILLGLGIAGPAVSQDYLGLALARDAERAAAAMAARQRDIELTNELAVLQARIQSEQALSNLQTARVGPTPPAILPNPNLSAPTIDASKLAVIPDTTLAASNARVRAAADNRR